jgi:hypothetical protein
MKADSTPMQENRLLEEGARSYFKAMRALGEFRRQIQEQCVAAFRADATDMAKAMQVQFSAADVKPWADPDKPGVEATWAGIGATVRRPKGAECFLWNYVLWRDDQPLTVLVSISFPEADVAEGVWAAVRPAVATERGTWEHDAEDEISISRHLATSDLARLKTVLDEMNHEWSSAWRKAGGVHQFLGRR